MPVLVTSNFDADSIKNERASMETPFSHYKSIGIFFFRRKGSMSPKVLTRRKGVKSFVDVVDQHMSLTFS